ncbi:DUF1266 domain-containing protein [Allorhizocola rhizosphaerae]|uniref:DUF1266 domain-containing protein n=1 Tax=Allorhizocola rhizosphaerae TaxID=1872709 RepID=UPI000E3E274A|nr:DUF1266 domain-containing protein [Allorhizocola rhizosphaerae]
MAHAALADSAVTTRHAVLLAVVGLILLAAALRAVYKRWRDRPLPPAEVACYTGEAPLPITDYTCALAVGALATLRAGDVLDAVGCKRSRRAIKRELRVAAAPYRHSVLGEEAMSTAIGRCVNDLLGPGAETVGSHFAAIEEVIRHRDRGGPALWHHSIDEWAGRARMPLAAVANLHRTAEQVARAEEDLRRIGILRAGEVVPTLLAVHWGQGVHLARGAIRVGWLDRAKGLNYLRRAGELAHRRYPSSRTLLAAQLLPAFVSGDADTIRWAETAAPPLLMDPRSPLVAYELAKHR